jgi:hypothetical protein
MKAPTVCKTAGSCVDATLPRRASSGQARHHYAHEVVFLNRVAITSQDVDARPLPHDWRWHHCWTWPQVHRPRRRRINGLAVMAGKL